MNKIQTQILVNDYKVNVLNIDGQEYISLTDLARYADEDEPRLPIRDWMRNKEVISFLGLWESMNNSSFKGGEFATFKNEATGLRVDFKIIGHPLRIYHTSNIDSLNLHNAVSIALYEFTKNNFIEK